MAKQNIMPDAQAETAKKQGPLTLETALEKIAALEGEKADLTAQLNDARKEIEDLVKRNQLLEMQEKGSLYPTFEDEKGNVYEFTVPITGMSTLPKFGTISNKEIMDRPEIRNALVQKGSGLFKLIKKGGES